MNESDEMKMDQLTEDHLKDPERLNSVKKRVIAKGHEPSEGTMLVQQAEPEAELDQ